MTEPLPNKCTYCGLRVFQWHQHMGSAKRADDTFLALKQLEDEGIIGSVPSRIVGVSTNRLAGEGTTQFCAINASAWRNKQTSCRHWQLKIEDAQLSDYLTIYHARKNQDIATALAVIAIVVGVVVAIVHAST